MVQFMSDVDLYMVQESERCCCTCAFWMGVRTSWGDGFIYSFQKLEGICKAWHGMEGADTVRGLTFPDAACASWRMSPEIAMTDEPDVPCCF